MAKGSPAELRTAHELERGEGAGLAILMSQFPIPGLGRFSESRRTHTLSYCIDFASGRRVGEDIKVLCCADCRSQLRVEGAERSLPIREER